MSHRANFYVKKLIVAPNGEKMTASEKSVLAQLADDHREEVGAAWRNMRDTAKLACVSLAQCRRILRELERKGVIESMPNFHQVKDGSTKFRQVSNEYRFCELDPPFDKKTVAVTAARMKYQKIQRERRPVQLKLAAINADERGGRSPMRGGATHRCAGAPLTDEREPHSPMSGPDSFMDSSVDSGVEPSSDQGNPPTPQRGAKIAPIEIESWNYFTVMLKSELGSIPNNLALAKQFTNVQPSPGFTPQTMNDYDVCFRDWWLVDVRRMPNGLLLITEAEDEEATAAGLQKYKSRLLRLAQRYFYAMRSKPVGPVTFKLLRDAGAKTAETVAPALVLTAPATSAAPSEPNAWEKAKNELLWRLERIGDMRERTEALKNFDEAIRPVKLISVEMDGMAPVWNLHAVNEKKTRAVMAMMRKHVSAALRAVAGGEVQVLVRDRLA